MYFAATPCSAGESVKAKATVPLPSLAVKTSFYPFSQLFSTKPRRHFIEKGTASVRGGALRSLRKVSLLHASLINKRLGSSSWLTAGLGVNLLGTLVRKVKGERPRLNISGTVCLLVHSPPPTQLGKHGFIGKIAACEARASLKMGCGEALK